MTLDALLSQHLRKGASTPAWVVHYRGSKSVAPDAHLSQREAPATAAGARFLRGSPCWRRVLFTHSSAPSSTPRRLARTAENNPCALVAPHDCVNHTQHLHQRRPAALTLPQQPLRCRHSTRPQIHSQHLLAIKKSSVIAKTCNGTAYSAFPHDS